jgi:hypothetical protein
MHARHPCRAPIAAAPDRRPAAVAAVGLASGALALAACGGQAATVALPSKAGAAAGSPAATADPPTPRQAIAAAYQGYWRAYAAAMTSSSAPRARVLLAPYEVPSGLPKMISSLRRVWAAHDVAYGGAVTHVSGVRVTGRRAVVHDCLDLSHFGVLDRTTGQVVPNSFGLPDQDYYVTLLLTGGRWRVSNMQPVEVPCKPT